MLDQAKTSLGQCWHVAWTQIKLHVDPKSMQMYNWELNVAHQGTTAAQYQGVLEQGGLLPGATKTREISSHCPVYEGSKPWAENTRAEARRTRAPGETSQPAQGGTLNFWRCFCMTSRGSTLCRNVNWGATLTKSSAPHGFP